MADVPFADPFNSQGARDGSGGADATRQKGAHEMIRARVETPMRSKALVMGFALAALMSFSLVLSSKPAYADAFTVTNALDSGAGSLRQAISDANAS